MAQISHQLYYFYIILRRIYLTRIYRIFHVCNFVYACIFISFFSQKIRQVFILRDFRRNYTQEIDAIVITKTNVKGDEK